MEFYGRLTAADNDSDDFTGSVQVSAMYILLFGTRTAIVVLFFGASKSVANLPDGGGGRERHE
jgi:hypothetical protein